MGEAGNVSSGNPEAVVRRCISRGRGSMCSLVVVRARREICRGGPEGFRGLALLDEIDCRRHRLDRRSRIYVYPVQSVYRALQKMASVQQVTLINNSCPSVLSIKRSVR